MSTHSNPRSGLVANPLSAIFRSQRNAHRFFCFMNGKLRTYTTHEKDFLADMAALFGSLNVFTASSSARFARVAMPVSLIALMFSGNMAHALPSYNSTGAGTVSVTTNGNTLNVVSGSNSAIVNYNSFNVGSNERVQFYVPNSSAAVLNRVLGSANPSTIAGQIRSNINSGTFANPVAGAVGGRIFLVNPAGMIFTGTSVINVGALTASTLSITNANFLNGNALARFEKEAGNPSKAIVINSGARINATEGIALIGSAINNAGTLTAPRISLAVGDKVTVDTASGLDITVTEALIDKVAGFDTAIRNSGRLNAQNGNVKIVSRLASSLYTTAINNTGVVEATGITNDNGHVALMSETQGAGVKAAILNSGTITTGDASDVSTASSYNVTVNTDGNARLGRIDSRRIRVDADNITLSAGLGRANAQNIVLNAINDINSITLSPIRSDSLSLTSANGSFGAFGNSIYTNVSRLFLRAPGSAYIYQTTNTTAIPQTLTLGSDANGNPSQVDTKLIVSSFGDIVVDGTLRSDQLKLTSISRDINVLDGGLLDGATNVTLEAQNVNTFGSAVVRGRDVGLTGNGGDVNANTQAQNLRVASTGDATINQSGTVNVKSITAGDDVVLNNSTGAIILDGQVSGQRVSLSAQGPGGNILNGTGNGVKISAIDQATVRTSGVVGEIGNALNVNVSNGDFSAEANGQIGNVSGNVIGTARNDRTQLLNNPPGIFFFNGIPQGAGQIINQPSSATPSAGAVLANLTKDGKPSSTLTAAGDLNNVEGRIINEADYIPQAFNLMLLDLQPQAQPVTPEAAPSGSQIKP